MGAAVHLSMTEVIFDALSRNSNLVVPITTFVLNHVDKKSNCVKKREDVAGLWREICEPPSFSWSSNPSDDNENLPIEKKKSTRTS